MAAAAAAVELVRARGGSVGIEASLAGSVPAEAVPTPQIAEADLVVAFGGDGTLIRAAHLCSERGTPILGVDFGRFGFVTQCPPNELPACLSAFLDGELAIEARMMMEATLRRGDATLARLHVLNEAVVQRSATDRMLTFEVEVDGRLLTRYPADGVMVSTPTGATGYALSAGGPVLDPTLEAMVLTAIAPHTLSARPLVLSPNATVTIRLDRGGDSILSGDGQTRLHLLGGEEVVVRRSDRRTNLVAVQTGDFLAKLGERLLWSRGWGSDGDA